MTIRNESKHLMNYDVYLHGWHKAFAGHFELTRIFKSVPKSVEIVIVFLSKAFVVVIQGCQQARCRETAGQH